MTMLRTAETVMRPASAALDTWFAEDRAPASGPHREALAAERLTIGAAINRLVARMDDDDIDADLLDDLTEDVAGLLGRAEELRLALALADRAAGDTWLVAVDLD
ncbi:hypothetical protein [uncultured Amnibacterium sp.]|uniref:hypothetical protein n=1 Tax=uncultured Amnibacterium sp. TaxID=1631851 RepID=UPI0035CC8385